MSFENYRTSTEKRHGFLRMIDVREIKFELVDCTVQKGRECFFLEDVLIIILTSDSTRFLCFYVNFKSLNNCLKFCKKIESYHFL